jgi:hypothetical protein
MNEQIRELINQVGTDVSGKWISVDNAEKLAELVVKECIDKVEVWETDSRNHISSMLKRHFGVEE